ncbi:MAG: ribosome maturation factor RimM [Corynebacterium sp.]|nr:ribosome maturation factor RimM [Corynebacterium sp.]
MELMIGRVVKPHGIRGEVAVEVTTDAPEVRFAIGEVLTGRQGRKETSLEITHARSHQQRLLLRFAEIPDRTAAESLRGMKFFAAPLEDDDEGFYDHELEGLKVIHDGQEIGHVSEVNHGPANELLLVELTDGKTVLIPFVHQIVPEVDLEAGEVIITPPEGLLDLAG